MQDVNVREADGSTDVERSIQTLIEAPGRLAVTGYTLASASGGNEQRATER